MLQAGIGGREFLQCIAINCALKGDNRIDRVPVVDPLPIVEFRGATGIKTYICRIAGHLQIKPALLLADTQRLGVFALHLFGNVVAQPALGSLENFHIVGLEADFFVELAIECILDRLAVIYTALGKLPSLLPNTLCPE